MPENFQYNQISEAILYLTESTNSQLSLLQKFGAKELDPIYLQNLLESWCRIMPEKLKYYLSEGYIKKKIKENHSNQFKNESDLLETNFSNIHLEPMTEAELKNGGETLEINYFTANTPFGDAFIAYTQKGICMISFINEAQMGVNELKYYFRNAKMKESEGLEWKNIIDVFNFNFSSEIRLHVKGTAFQISIWENLLKIQPGELTTYSNLALRIQNPKSARAVGAAVGSNPIAWLIPCHRVVPATGIIGEYRWGTTRKQAMIGWEAAKLNSGFQF